MVKTPERLIIEKSVGGLYLIIAGSLLFMGLGLWLIFTAVSANDNRAFTLVLGASTLVFFGSIAVLALKRLTTKEPPLVLEDSGFTDFSSFSEVGFIPWSEVEEIGEYWYRGNSFITVYLSTPQVYTSDRRFPQKLVDYANTLMCGTPVAISTHGLDANHQELLRQFQNYHKLATTALCTQAQGIQSSVEKD